MNEIVQLGAALLVLAAFVLSQANRLATTSRLYLLLNVVGAGLLAVDAALLGQPGFLLLEGVWALVALVGLARTFRARPAA